MSGGFLDTDIIDTSSQTGGFGVRADGADRIGKAAVGAVLHGSGSTGDLAVRAAVSRGGNANQAGGSHGTVSLFDGRGCITGNAAALDGAGHDHLDGAADVGLDQGIGFAGGTGDVGSVAYPLIGQGTSVVGNAGNISGQLLTELGISGDGHGAGQSRNIVCRDVDGLGIAGEIDTACLVTDIIGAGGQAGNIAAHTESPTIIALFLILHFDGHIPDLAVVIVGIRTVRAVQVGDTVILAHGVGVCVGVKLGIGVTCLLYNIQSTFGDIGQRVGAASCSEFSSSRTGNSIGHTVFKVAQIAGIGTGGLKVQVVGRRFLCFGIRAETKSDIAGRRTGDLHLSIINSRYSYAILLGNIQACGEVITVIRRNDDVGHSLSLLHILRCVVAAGHAADIRRGDINRIVVNRDVFPKGSHGGVGSNGNHGTRLILTLSVYLPSLKLLVGRSGKGTAGQMIITAGTGNGSHRAAAPTGIKGDGIAGNHGKVFPKGGQNGIAGHDNAFTGVLFFSTVYLPSLKLLVGRSGKCAGGKLIGTGGVGNRSHRAGAAVGIKADDVSRSLNGDGEVDGLFLQLVTAIAGYPNINGFVVSAGSKAALGSKGKGVIVSAIPIIHVEVCRGVIFQRTRLCAGVHNFNHLGVLAIVVRLCNAAPSKAVLVQFEGVIIDPLNGEGFAVKQIVTSNFNSYTIGLGRCRVLCGNNGFCGIHRCGNIFPVSTVFLLEYAVVSVKLTVTGRGLNGVVYRVGAADSDLAVTGLHGKQRRGLVGHGEFFAVERIAGGHSRLDAEGLGAVGIGILVDDGSAGGSTQVLGAGPVITGLALNGGSRRSPDASPGKVVVGTVLDDAAGGGHGERIGVGIKPGNGKLVAVDRAVCIGHKDAVGLGSGLGGNGAVCVANGQVVNLCPLVAIFHLKLSCGRCTGNGPGEVIGLTRFHNAALRLGGEAHIVVAACGEVDADLHGGGKAVPSIGGYGDAINDGMICNTRSDTVLCGQADVGSKVITVLQLD